MALSKKFATTRVGRLYGRDAIVYLEEDNASICKNANCAGNFSFNYFYVFLKIKFIVNIQTKMFDVLLHRDQWLPTFNRIVKHRFFHFGRNYHGFSWNDRRSRRVFLCFYSAIFQLTSAKFQSFAYNSRTVGPSYMKFWLQFEINEFYVCTQFRGIRSRDFGFRTRKPPRKFGVKSGLSQKRLKYGKKHFIGLYVSRYSFIPTNPRLAAMRFISFFFPFFSS